MADQPVYRAVSEADCGERDPTAHPRRYGCHNHGYGGSGPAELAKDLLWDYLGRRPHPALYQAFKDDFIARFPQGQSWWLDGSRVLAWLATRPDVQWLDAGPLAGPPGPVVEVLRAEIALRRRFLVPTDPIERRVAEWERFAAEEDEEDGDG
jgi:hypothetical protein